MAATMPRQGLAPFPDRVQGGFESVPYRLWFHQLAIRVREAGQILWSQLDFTDSTITDIANRKHNDLTDIQGGLPNDHFHWSDAEKDFAQTMAWLTIEG